MALASRRSLHPRACTQPISHRPLPKSPGGRTVRLFSSDHAVDFERAEPESGGHAEFWKGSIHPRASPDPKDYLHMRAPRMTAHRTPLSV
jgi:hypothetical protein